MHSATSTRSAATQKVTRKATKHHDTAHTRTEGRAQGLRVLAPVVLAHAEVGSAQEVGKLLARALSHVAECAEQAMDTACYTRD